VIHQEESEKERYLPSERELGQRFGADRLTVRKALDLLVRDGLIQKQPGKGTVVLPVAEAAKVPDSKSVAFVLPRGTHSVDRITEPFNAKLFYLIEKDLKNRGYHLLYTTVGTDEGIPESIRQSGTAGAFFVSQVPEKTLKEAVRMKLPAVLINRTSDRIPMILEDRRRGFRGVLDHLFELGHRRILFINGVAGHYTTENCDAACREFAAARSGERVETRILPSYWNFDSGKEVMEEVLRAPGQLPTAVCACNDMVALGAMEAAKQAGYKVPGDMSFVGFDDTDQCTQCNPRLSTVNVNSPVIARLAVETLFSILSQGSPGPIRTIVPTRLILRESTRPPQPN
jgi:LacI family transcriptional regulator